MGLGTSDAALNRELNIPYVSWRAHVAWMRQHFHPGQHISVCVPTGGGKSYLVIRGLLVALPVMRHARILLIDDKGDDSTTRDFGLPISQYPLTWQVRMRQKEEDPKHYRLIVPDWEWMPGQAHTRGVEHARSVVGRAMNAWYKDAHEGSPSMVILDETAAVTGTSPPSLNLAPLAKRNWRKLRYKDGSQVALTQAPLGVPSEFYHQPTHLYIGPMLDQEQRRRLREIGGNSKSIERCVENLKDREFLFLGHKGRHMHILMVGRN